MPDWSFPVSLPRFTDEEFNSRRDRYVSNHGYWVNAPALGEIIKIRSHPEPTQAEWDGFRTSSLAKSHPYRHTQIIELLNMKRARRDRILASPVPTIVKNITTILTVLDDINDTLGTAGIVMRVAARWAPKHLAKFMLGPIGWLFLLADIAGIFLAITRLPFACISRKRIYEKVRDMNPFSKKARVKRALKVRRLRPSKGELIEAAQTSDNIFGIGLCLGPIMGYAFDILSGIIRAAAGQEVHYGTPPSSRPKHTKPSSRLLRNSPALHGVGEEISDHDHMGFMIALNGATQLLKPYIDAWHPLDQVENFDAVLFEAPRPIHPTTKFVLEEVGIHEGEGIGWPGLDKDLVHWEELWDHTQHKAANNFMDFAVRNRNNYRGAIGCQNGDEFGMNMLLMTEGYETVNYESLPIWKGYHNFFISGCAAVQCGSFGKGGSYWFLTKCHAIPIPPHYLIVCGSSWPSRVFKDEAAGGWLHCKNCQMYIGTQMAPIGYDRWVVSAWIVDEGAYLELIRKRQL